MAVQAQPRPTQTGHTPRFYQEGIFLHFTDAYEKFFRYVCYHSPNDCKYESLNDTVEYAGLRMGNYQESLTVSPPCSCEIPARGQGHSWPHKMRQLQIRTFFYEERSLSTSLDKSLRMGCKPIEDGRRNKPRQKKYEYANHFTGCPIHARYFSKLMF